MPMKRTRKQWTSVQLRTFKSLARRRVPARNIARYFKRTEGAIRQKAFAIGLSLETRV